MNRSNFKTLDLIKNLKALNCRILMVEFKILNAIFNARFLLWKSLSTKNSTSLLSSIFEKSNLKLWNLIYCQKIKD